MKFSLFFSMILATTSALANDSFTAEQITAISGQYRMVSQNQNADSFSFQNCDPDLTITVKKDSRIQIKGHSYSSRIDFEFPFQSTDNLSHSYGDGYWTKAFHSMEMKTPEQIDLNSYEKIRKSYAEMRRDRSFKIHFFKNTYQYAFSLRPIDQTLSLKYDIRSGSTDDLTPSSGYCTYQKISTK